MINYDLQISFVIPMEAIPGRMGLLLTLLLCMVNIFNSMEKYPKSATAMTNWILSCIIYITLPIIEYAILLGYKKFQKTRNTNGKNVGIGKAEMDRLSKCLDKWMLIIFPPTFLIFAVLFWSSH